MGATKCMYNILKYIVYDITSHDYTIQTLYSDCSLKSDEKRDNNVLLQQ